VLGEAREEVLSEHEEVEDELEEEVEERVVRVPAEGARGQGPGRRRPTEGGAWAGTSVLMDSPAGSSSSSRNGPDFDDDAATTAVTELEDSYEDLGSIDDVAIDRRAPLAMRRPAASAWAEE